MIAGQFGSTANVTLMPIKQRVLNQIRRSGSDKKKIELSGKEGREQFEKEETEI